MSTRQRAEMKRKCRSLDSTLIKTEGETESFLADPVSQRQVQSATNNNFKMPTAENQDRGRGRGRGRGRVRTRGRGRGRGCDGGQNDNAEKKNEEKAVLQQPGPSVVSIFVSPAVAASLTASGHGVLATKAPSTVRRTAQLPMQGNGQGNGKDVPVSKGRKEDKIVATADQDVAQPHSSSPATNNKPELPKKSSNQSMQTKPNIIEDVILPPEPTSTTTNVNKSAVTEGQEIKVQDVLPADAKNHDDQKVPNNIQCEKDDSSMENSYEDMLPEDFEQPEIVYQHSAQFTESKSALKRRRKEEKAQNLLLKSLTKKVELIEKKTRTIKYETLSQSTYQQSPAPVPYTAPFGPFAPFSTSYQPAPYQTGPSQFYGQAPLFYQGTVPLPGLSSHQILQPPPPPPQSHQPQLPLLQSFQLQSHQPPLPLPQSYQPHSHQPPLPPPQSYQQQTQSQTYNPYSNWYQN